MPPYAGWLGEAARHLRMPIPDVGVPTPEQMVQTVKRSSPWITSRLLPRN